MITRFVRHPLPSVSVARIDHASSDPGRVGKGVFLNRLRDWLSALFISPGADDEACCQRGEEDGEDARADSNSDYGALGQTGRGGFGLDVVGHGHGYVYQRRGGAVSVGWYARVADCYYGGSGCG